VPLPVADRIHFVPALPAARRAWHAGVAAGRVFKAVLAFERPFWRERG
jgi:monoamine oxidase